MPRRFSLSPSWLFFGFSLVFLAVAGFLFLNLSSGPALEVTETDFEIKDLASGENRDIVLHLNNTSARPVRVLGLTVC